MPPISWIHPLVLWSLEFSNIKQNKRKVEVVVPSQFLLGEQHLGNGVLLRHAWELQNFIFTVSLELDWNYTSLVVENFIGNPFEDRGWKPGFAEGKRNFCCWSQAGSWVASLVCPRSKTLRSAMLPGISESMAFVRLRHVSWQHNDLEPNFRDAEPPSFPPATRIQVSEAESRTLPNERRFRCERGNGSQPAGVYWVSLLRCSFSHERWICLRANRDALIDGSVMQIKKEKWDG